MRAPPAPDAPPHNRDCPSVDTIMAYVEGALDDAACQQIDAHVDTCPSCSAVVAHAIREAGVAASRGEPTPVHGDAPWSALPLPTRVGRYVILEKLGQGGMGVVCAAYDPRLRRTVAVKLLRPDRNDAQAATRLRREARALATLSHPNVVSVFECGPLEDREGDYLVMELVAGETMRRWCARTQPTAAQIVAAYTEAARGLAAAHATGLVHRDFKPDNVLVEAHPDGGDRSGRVRVTDFGLAREAASVDDTLASGARSDGASEIAGTPSYMAPEQRTGGAVGPAADQYAFCVSLWEALAGACPPAGDAKRIPARVRTALLRGLAIDPAARWPSMDALVDALTPARRWVTPARVVIAGLVIAGAVRLTSTQSTATSSVCLDAASRMDDAWGPERREAFVRRATAPDVVAALDDWTTKWRARAAAACVDAPDQLADGGCLSLAAIELETMVDVLERAPAIDVVLRSAVHDVAPPETCAGRRPTAGDPAAAAAVRDRLAQATTLAASHRFDAARSLAAEAVALAHAVDDAVLAEALASESKVLHAAGDYRGEAERAEAAHLLAEATGQDELAASIATGRVFTTSQIENDYPSAKIWARHAAAAVDRMPSAARPLARARLDVALAHIDQGEGRLEEAAARLEGAIPRLEGQPEVSASELAGVYNDLGATLVDRDPDAALAGFEQALTLIRDHYGDEHPRVAMLRSNIGGVYYYGGDLERAAGHFEAAAQVLGAILGERHPDVAGAYMNLALVRDQQGDTVAARAAMARGTQILEAALEPDHPDLAMARTNLGAFELRHGDLDAAEAAFRQALVMLESTVGPDHVYCGNALRGLAEVALARGQPERAVALRQRSLDIDAGNDVDAVMLAAERLELAEAQAAAGDREAAQATVSNAIASLEAEEVPADPEGRVEQLAELRAWSPDAPLNAADAGSG